MALASEGAGGMEQVVRDRGAHSAQAELAPKCPDGRCAKGLSIRSANTDSMIA